MKASLSGLLMSHREKNCRIRIADSDMSFILRFVLTEDVNSFSFCLHVHLGLIREIRKMKTRPLKDQEKDREDQNGECIIILLLKK